MSESNKTITINKEDFNHLCMEVSSELSRKDAKLVDDPMMGMMSLMITMSCTKELTKRLFGDDEEEDN